MPSYETHDLDHDTRQYWITTETQLEDYLKGLFSTDLSEMARESRPIAVSRRGDFTLLPSVYPLPHKDFSLRPDARKTAKNLMDCLKRDVKFDSDFGALIILSSIGALEFFQYSKGVDFERYKNTQTISPSPENSQYLGYIVRFSNPDFQDNPREDIFAYIRYQDKIIP